MCGYHVCLLWVVTKCTIEEIVLELVTSSCFYDRTNILLQAKSSVTGELLVYTLIYGSWQKRGQIRLEPQSPHSFD
jgi:hypothetical protein